MRARWLGLLLLGVAACAGAPDAPTHAPARAIAPAPESAVPCASNGATVHAASAGPQRLADLAYVPSGRPLEDVAELVVEDVDPTCDYAEAWKPVAEKLASVKYPFERRAFSSSYGTGKMMVFWLGSTSNGPRPPTPPIGCVLRSESSPARFMRKMSLP